MAQPLPPSAALSLALPFFISVIVCVCARVCVCEGRGIVILCPIALPLHSDRATPFARDNFPSPAFPSFSSLPPPPVRHLFSS